MNQDFHKTHWGFYIGLCAREQAAKGSSNVPSDRAISMLCDTSWTISVSWAAGGRNPITPAAAVASEGIEMLQTGFEVRELVCNLQALCGEKLRLLCLTG